MPPVPEPVSGQAELERLARLRDDDLLYGGDMFSFDLPRMMETVTEVVQQYSDLCGARFKPAESASSPDTAGAGAPAVLSDGPETDDSASYNVNEVLFSLMSETDKLADLARLMGKLRFAVEGRDSGQAEETSEEIAVLAKHLPDNFQVASLLSAARDTSPKSSRLAQLYLDRCFRLSAGDHSSVQTLESEIRSSGPRTSIRGRSASGYCPARYIDPRARADPNLSGWYVFLAYLSRLTLTNYRNLVHMELDLPRGVLVFFGPNAQGKTTLLEAAYTLAIARSFRAENEREVVNFDAAARGEMALVGGALESAGSELQVYVGYQPTPGPTPDDAASHSARRLAWTVRKQIRVSRVRRTATELVGMVHAVLFGADDIELVFGPPSLRRRFLNILLSQTDPSYVKSLQRYQKVVQQRNRLLKAVGEGRADSQELEFWTDQLVSDGVEITQSRRQAIARLGPIAAEKHRQLSAADGEVKLLYRPSVPVGSTVLSRVLS